MQIHLIPEAYVKSDLPEIGYSIVKLPEIGAAVYINDDMTSKAYEVVKLVVTSDISGMSGIATIALIDDDLEVIPGTSQDIKISHISAI